MLIALGMLLMRSLPPSRQQLLDKHIESGDLLVDPLDAAYLQSKVQVVDDIIAIVAKDSPADAIKRLTNLSKLATECTKWNDESISHYVESFVAPAQSHHNIPNADRTYCNSQTLAMTRLTNANISSQTLSSLMATLVTMSQNGKTLNDTITKLTSARFNSIASVLS